MTPSNYDWALDLVDKDKTLEIKCVAEIGSWHGKDAIDLAMRYQAKVYVFEPDPINYLECKKNIQSSITKGLDIELFDMALSDTTGIVQFHSIDSEKYPNRGASSLFEIDFSKRPDADPDARLGRVQKLVNVKASRYEDLGLRIPQLIAMDVQGAELKVLKGFGGGLSEVSAIILETSFAANYVGGSTFPQIHKFPKKMGFGYIVSTRYGTKIPRKSLLGWIMRRYPGGDFDCLYIRKRLKS